MALATTTTNSPNSAPLGGGPSGSYQINTGQMWPIQPIQPIQPIEPEPARDARSMLEDLLEAMFDGEEDDRVLEMLVAIRERLTLEREAVESLCALYDRLAERLGSI